PALPTRTRGAVSGYDIRIQTQCNLLLRVWRQWPSGAADICGQFRQNLGKGLCGLEIRLSPFGIIGNGFPICFGITATGFKFGFQLGHSKPLSFRLAGRIEMIDRASVPRGRKTTAMTSWPDAGAVNRASGAGGS